MKIVYVAEPRVIAYGGMRITLTPGEPWDGDDPFVKANRDAFVDGPRTVRSTVAPGGLIEVPAEPKRGPGRPPKAVK